MAHITALDHFTVHTSRLDETIEFYERVLGLENRPERRPPFDFPGAWLFLGDKPLVHLVGQDDDPGRPNGSFDHIAFHAADFDALCSALAADGIDHDISDSEMLGLRQVFFRDPNGIRVEVTTPFGS